MSWSQVNSETGTRSLWESGGFQQNSNWNPQLVLGLFCDLFWFGLRRNGVNLSREPVQASRRKPKEAGWYEHIPDSTNWSFQRTRWGGQGTGAYSFFSSFQSFQDRKSSTNTHGDKIAICCKVRTILCKRGFLKRAESNEREAHWERWISFV